METPKDTKALLNTLSNLTAYTIIRDGLMQGFLPGYRLVTINVKEGKATLTVSSHKYLLDEAMAMVEDRSREGLGL